MTKLAFLDQAVVTRLPVSNDSTAAIGQFQRPVACAGLYRRLFAASERGK
jgi:hypothetical protein